MIAITAVDITFPAMAKATNEQIMAPLMHVVCILRNHRTATTIATATAQ